MVLFSFYALIMIFILLTMMLKIVDNAFHDMRWKMHDPNSQRENLALQMRLAIRKVFYDIYWKAKVNSVIKSAQMTEKVRAGGAKRQLVLCSNISLPRFAPHFAPCHPSSQLIESMNKTGKGIAAIGKDKKGKKEAKYVDESILDLVEADASAKKEEEERLKKEEEVKKKAERKERKKASKMSRSERKKRRAERPKEDTNLPENRRVVREAIKAGRLGTVKEDEIDPLEISDRLDMISHRSDILIRSAERLLDQIMVLAEEANKLEVDGDDDDIIVNKKTVSAPYGKTGDMFGLRGVREPQVGKGEAITDLEQGEGEVRLERSDSKSNITHICSTNHPPSQVFAMKVPKEDPALKEIDEPADGVTMGDIGDMYKSLGYSEDVAEGAARAEEERADEMKEMEEKELKEKMKDLGKKG